MTPYDPSAAVAEFEQKFCDKVLDINGNLAYREFKSEEDADDAIHWLEKALLAAHAAGKREGQKLSYTNAVEAVDEDCWGDAIRGSIIDAARADGVELG